MKFYIKSLMLLVLCIAIYSCSITENENNVYNGRKFAAFKFQHDQIQAAKSVPYKYTLEVQVIRPKEGKLKKALPINFRVIGDATTAVSPDDYKFLTPSPVTIPAGSLRTELIISIDGSAIPPGDSRVLTVQLTGNKSRGVEGADIIGQFKLTIVGK